MKKKKNKPNQRLSSSSFLDYHKVPDDPVINH